MAMGDGIIVCLPTGLLTTPGVSREILWGRQIREEACQWFEQEWVHADGSETKSNTTAKN